ncbi:hypothetical protein BDP27DRAFT_1368549 [Rhodocollybia butyracea]|uniref:Uncharacterized protein n=1 Tax=Rhodocollybia butyracea TaxID=206335 RepID=A0A9P5PCY3_9AGAR|nr:hypothetical protein BDP27DRAFT_1374416 [Rhodocollybia butyracea]KAF9062104.1 hypothetical protein BDP27DRAFT_1369141 [Rhodocollybia butyracea]KAF9062841.1 hypothetical protein BDP27DRAFT_1368549 [Rhodocollybia butyracea]
MILHLSLVHSLRLDLVTELECLNGLKDTFQADMTRSEFEEAFGPFQTKADAQDALSMAADEQKTLYYSQHSDEHAIKTLESWYGRYRDKVQGQKWDLINLRSLQALQNEEVIHLKAKLAASDNRLRDAEESMRILRGHLDNLEKFIECSICLQKMTTVECKPVFFPVLKTVTTSSAQIASSASNNAPFAERRCGQHILQ